MKSPDITGSLDFTKMTTAPVPPPPEARGVERFRLDPAIEEAALLYANGQSSEAKARLAQAVAGGLPEAAEERAWLMLLEAHQVLGERGDFDARSIAYAEKFLRSAPSWRAPAATSSAAPRAGGPYVSLTGKLSAESAAQLQKVLGIAIGSRSLRLDFAKLQGADGPGCRALLDMLQALRRAGVAVAFSGESVLLGPLSRATRAGAKDVDRSLWLLRLEILQWLGRQAEFDDVALDYAVTYEVSPPSFESLPAPAAAAGTSPAGGAATDAIELPAELAGTIDEVLQRIDEVAAAQESVSLDCSRTQRIDFAAAGGLLHAAERLAGAGKYIEFRHPNALVAALLEVIGIATHATLVARS